MTIKVKLERQKCIGCGSCVSVCPNYFEMKKDGRSHLIGSEADEKAETEELEVEIKGEESEENSPLEKAEALCPVRCIHIKKSS